MMPILRSVAVLASVLSVAACATSPSSAPRADAAMQGRSGASVSGMVSFVAAGDAIDVQVRVSGLTPGQHGFHIHESGDCSAPDASSAKGHFNPHGKMHGEHGGDMPNLVADAYGNAEYRGRLAGVMLDAGAHGIVGRSVVIHADPDDYKSQPAGNSGKRVACGTIRMS